MKIITILGTRPEIIRLSRIIPLLDEFTHHVLVHTGQNYDYELNEIFFEDLEVRKPDYFLEVDTSSLGKMYGDTLIKVEEVLTKEKPDAVLILGDTNSSIACLIAKRMKIPIYHMEAGNRCFDFNVPEEVNRKIIDHIADFNLVYTEHGRRNLLSEGFPARRIYLTGSPMKEIINYYKSKIDASEILSHLNLQKDDYFVVSAHREDNVDRKKNIHRLFDILKAIQNTYNRKIIVSTHPRTRDRLNKISVDYSDEQIVFMKPFGYFDYMKLQKNSFCTLSDSGTISEEAAIMGFNAITIRSAMERPEAMDTGHIITTGLEKEAVLSAIEYLSRSQKKYSELPAEYAIENFSDRVLKLIIGTAKLSNKWSGIEQNDLTSR